MNSDLVYAIFFWFFSALVLVSGMLAAYLKNILQSALALFFTFFGVAGLFLLLGADFLAIAQVVVYAGGILVLILVGILVTHHTRQSLDLALGKPYVAGTLMAVGFGVVLAVLIAAGPSGQWLIEKTGPPVATSRPIGELLLTRYLLPFEISSVTLLMSLLGASYMVRRKE